VLGNYCNNPSFILIMPFSLLSIIKIDTPFLLSLHTKNANTLYQSENQCPEKTIP